MRSITPLTENWQFARLENAVLVPPLQLASMETVSLPHVWNREEPGAFGCCLYRTQFAATLAAGQRAYLAFDAVCGVARVFLNGVFLGEHRGSYSRFVLEATASLHPANTLEVLADNTRFDDVNPLMGDFTYWGGIPRPVNLLTVEADHFEPAYYGAPGLEILEANAEGQLHLNARVCGGAGCEVEYLVTDAEGRLAAHCRVKAETPAVWLSVKSPHLWNGQTDPYCYRCTARLLRENAICDEVSLPFGFRSISLDAENGFCLNGKRLRLNGVARHHDRQGAGCALTAAQVEEDFAILRDLGANAVRLSHYQHPQQVYDLCDTEGLVAWAEIPMLAMPEGNEAVVKNACTQLKELILQNRHHPSICFWGVQNEIAMMGEHLAMYRHVRELSSLAKTLDNTRLTAAANLYSVRNGSQLNRLTDAVGYNIYFGWYYGELTDYSEFFERFHADNPDVALGVTEYGVDCNTRYHTDTPECKDYTEEFQCLYHEKAYAAMQADARLWGTFVWNLFDFSSAIRDEGGVKARNCKGLVTWDRAIKKDAYYYYKACWSKRPFVYLAGRRYAKRCGETTVVKIYSNQPSVALYVNGRLFAEQSGRTVFTFAAVPLTETTSLEARAGNCRDTILLYRTALPEPDYVCPRRGAGNRVTNWFKQQRAEVELFPKGRYSVTDKIGELLADPRTAAILQEELPAIIENPRARTMGGMTLMRVLDYNADAITEEQVLAVNAKLNTVPKPE
ncbi:MAG: beta-galactosidase [Subdoligranulum variabile]|nr:MAG: beta-galactosidase [Subdoligranulum variabile]